MGNAATKDGTHRSFNEINHHHNEHPHPHKRRNSKDGGEVVDDDTGSQVQASWKLEHARDVLHAGNDLFKEQKFNEAKKRYAEAIETLQHGAGSSRSHDNHVAGLSNLGVMEFAEGRYEEAKRLLQEALNHRREYLGQNDSKQTSNISSLYIALKKDKEYHHRASIDLGHDASHLIEHSTVDGLTAELLHNLAACHQKTGDLETAKKLYEECLQLRKVIDLYSSSRFTNRMHSYVSRLTCARIETRLFTVSAA